MNNNPSKLEKFGKFVTDHPFFTIVSMLIVDGWVTNLMRTISNRRKENIIDVEFKEVKGESNE